MTASVSADSADARRNAEVVQRFFSEILAPPHALGRLDQFIAADFVDATPDGSDATRDGVEAKLRALIEHDPAAAFHLESVVAAGDAVATMSTLDAGGTRTRFADYYTLRDGLITAHQHVFSAIT